MGCGSSHPHCPDEDVIRLADSTRFSRQEIRSLYKRFFEIDVEGNGYLSTDDFLSITELALNPLVMRVISVFDQSGEDAVDFDTFVKIMEVFHPRTPRDEKLTFVFRVYDVNNDNKLDIEELMQVMKMLVGSNLTPKQLRNICKRTLDECDTTGDGCVEVEEFLQAMHIIDDIHLSIRF